MEYVWYVYVLESRGSGDLPDIIHILHAFCSSLKFGDLQVPKQVADPEALKKVTMCSNVQPSWVNVTAYASITLC